MSVSANTLRRLAVLKLPPEAMAEVLAILVESQEAEDARKAAQRARKAKSRDKDVTVTGKGRDCHSDMAEQKESPQTPIEKLPSSSLRGSEEAQPSDPIEKLWFEGVPILVGMGLRDRDARSNIGRWLRNQRNDAAAVLGAIQRARDHGSRDPIPLVGRILNPVTRNGLSKPSVHDAAAALELWAKQGNEGIRDAAGPPALRLLSQG